jgi:molecular chaperone GrpE
MSESPPPAVPANPSESPGQMSGSEQASQTRAAASAGLDPDRLATVLDDFEDWLTALPAEAPGSAGPQAAERVDLHTLLGSFLALRHEVNLQTKAVRAQQEQNNETLRQLTLAVETLEDQNQTSAAELPAESEEGLRANLKTLADLYDALALAAREVQRVREAVLPVLDQLTTGDPAAEAELAQLMQPAPPARRPFWARWLGMKSPDTGPVHALHGRLVALRQREAGLARTAAERIRQMLTSVMTGYTMSLQRLERALQSQGLEQIRCENTPYDPELMEVLEAVDGSNRPAGEVVEEVRRGYLWKGRVFRYAQVRVARS